MDGSQGAGPPTVVPGRRTARQPMGPLADYLRSIRRVPLLTAGEEVELAKRIEAGVIAGHRLPTTADPAVRADLERMIADGRAARERMITANLRLVVAFARAHRGQGMDLLDLIGEGNVGLIRAVERFDYRQGTKFSTYASWSIRQAISRAVAHRGRTIRLPARVEADVGRLQASRRALYLAHRRDPTPVELAHSLSLAPSQVGRLQLLQQPPRSLDEAVPACTGEDADGDTWARLADCVCDADAPRVDDRVAAAELRGSLEGLLATLPGHEAQVIRLRFGLHDEQPMGLAATAQRLGLSAELVRQIEIRALSRLARAAGRRELHDFLE